MASKSSAKTAKTKTKTKTSEENSQFKAPHTRSRKLLVTQDDYPMPDLIEIQTDSYKWFIEDGIRDLLEEISPITDFSGKKLELHFLEHSIGESKHSSLIAKQKNLTFEAPLKVHVQLINKETGEIKEQDVFL